MGGTLSIPWIWLLVLLELLLVALVWGIWQYIRLRRLRSRAGKQGAGTTVSIMNWLEDQIEETERRKAAAAQHQGGTVPVALFERRAGCLRAELEAWRAVEDEGRDFWAVYSGPEGLARIRETRSLEQSLQREREREQQLVRQLEAAQKRLANLEKFRELFFEMKTQLENSRSINARLRDAVDRHVPVEQRPGELRELLQHLEEENRKLAGEMEAVESALDEMLRVGSERLTEEPGSVDLAALSSGIGQRLLVLRRNYVRQAELIHALPTQLQEATGLDAGKPVRELIEELEETQLELRQQVVRLEEENEFLATQISMLLRQELETEQEHDQEKALLEEQLAKAREALTRSENQVAELERRLLELHGG